MQWNLRSLQLFKLWGMTREWILWVISPRAPKSPPNAAALCKALQILFCLSSHKADSSSQSRANWCCAICTMKNKINHNILSLAILENWSGGRVPACCFKQLLCSTPLSTAVPQRMTPGLSWAESLWFWQQRWKTLRRSKSICRWQTSNKRIYKDRFGKFGCNLVLTSMVGMFVGVFGPRACYGFTVFIQATLMSW